MIESEQSKRSETITNLAASLAIAQGQIKPASKDAKGNYSKYSTLDAIWDACRQPLAENGLSVVQIPTTGEGVISLETILLHSSGEWISGTIDLPIVSGRMNEHQALGSALTYARRYSLAAIVGVASGDDDDGNASGKLTERPTSFSDRSQGNGQRPDETIPWQDKNPSLDLFIEMANREFGLEKNDIFDELKEANFSGYKPSLATKMWEALEIARNRAMDKEKDISPDQVPMTESQAVRTAGDETGLEELYPEIFKEET